MGRSRSQLMQILITAGSRWSDLPTTTVIDIPVIHLADVQQQHATGVTLNRHKPPPGEAQSLRAVDP